MTYSAIVSPVEAWFRLVRERRSSGGKGRDTQQQGHGSIVDQTDLHISSKAPLRDAQRLAGGVTHAVIEQSPSILGRSRRRETRPGALARVGGERELRHQQQIAASVEKAAIHAPFGILEHPVAEQPIDQTLGLCLTVATLDGNEDQKPGAD